MKQKRNNNFKVSSSKWIALIGGIIILVLQTVTAFSINYGLRPLLLDKFNFFPILRLYCDRLTTIFDHIDYLPLFHLYRFICLAVTFIAAAPLLYIFFFLFLRLRRDKLVKIFWEIFIIVLMIDLLKAIWRVWFFKEGPLLICDIWTLDVRTTFFPSKFLHLVLWIVFVRIDSQFGDFKSITKTLFFQCLFWITFFWFLVHIGVSSNPDYFYYGYDPTPYFLFSFISLLICQTLAITQIFMMFKEEEKKVSNEK